MIIGMFEYSDIVNCTITTIIVVTKWFLWKARNNKKFNNAQFEQNQILKTIRLSLVEFVSIKMFRQSCNSQNQCGQLNCQNQLQL